MKKLYSFIAAVSLSMGVNAQIATNYSLVTHPTAGAGGAPVSALQSTSLGMTLFGQSQNQAANYYMAEKIMVPASGWIIDSLINYGYQTGSTTVSTMTGHYCWIAMDSAGMPSYTTVIGSRTTNAMVYSSWTGIYRAIETSLTDANRPIMKIKSNLSGTLPTGTYWVGWGVTGSLASGPWNPPVTVLGQTTTGAAMQFTTTGWGPALDGSSPQGAPYKLYGKINTGLNATPSLLSSVELFPNPVVSAATVKIELAQNSGLSMSDVSLVVFDQLGRQVMSYPNISSNTFTIERGELATGSYMYKVLNKNNGNVLKTDKLVIQ
jgi:hypothetical protein